MKRTKWTRRRVISHGLLLTLLVAVPLLYAVTPTEAPAGFDNLTNGFEDQPTMDADRASFDQVEQISDGLGPMYNAQACRECHQNPVSGAISQITELRAGSFDGFTFTPHPGGSLIFSRSIDANFQVRAFGTDNNASFRTSLNTAGDGFVEALPDSFFTNTQYNQGQFGGTIITVPVNESPGVNRIGRFGWKNQHASLLSFSADAYLNEMGITSPMQPTENTDSGTDVSFMNAKNGVPAIQDPAIAGHPFGHDVEAFTRFMRSLKVPPRDTGLAGTPDAQAGAYYFHAIGCDICHIQTATSAPTGTSFNGGKFIVPAALGSKNIHPFGDFMLHDVGTGDGIVQNGGQGTINLMRTAPLWGVRTRNRLMHDGENITRNNAILRHTNQAEPVIQNYIYGLSTTQKNQLITFLNSL
ncbi:MAG TPA: di-heme oxidoredictase family protein [Thermoanaerobaculia bacterium]|nr:di-heme oxidoredictase family protein [Thermoanaerobaculia bacterium]